MSDFWSRRRAAVAAEALAREPAPTPEPETPEPERSDDEVLAALGLPDPDTLGPGSDFAAFMRREVPGALRRRALRRLWGSNPVLAGVDGLVDYGGDFTDAATVKGVLATTYEVGRGMVARAQEATAEDEEAADGPADGSAGADVEGTPSDDPASGTEARRTASAGIDERTPRDDARPIAAEGPDAGSDGTAPPPPARAARDTGARPLGGGPLHGSSGPDALARAEPSPRHAPRGRMRFDVA